LALCVPEKVDVSELPIGIAKWRLLLENQSKRNEEICEIIELGFLRNDNARSLYLIQIQASLFKERINLQLL
jgi:hypothetical protein